jgi:hypothetical protein
LLIFVSVSLVLQLGDKLLLLEGGVSTAADTAQAKDASVGPRQGTRPRRPNTRVMGADWA